MHESGISGIGQRQSWERYNSDIVKVILEALVVLRNRDDLVTDEVDLTRKLFFSFKRAAYNLGLNYHLPTPEGNNPPYEGDEQRARRENKRPDFYWQFCDDTIDDPKWCDRRFVLECKRLGSPRSSSPKWILNENYLYDGIDRFLKKEHEYAKGDDSAAMIGFVESMEFDVILREVNMNIASYELAVPPLSLSEEGWQYDNVSHLEHMLVRSFPISPFQLLHFWLDIRSCNLHAPETKSSKKLVEQADDSSRKKEHRQTTRSKRTASSKEQKREASSQKSSQLELPIDELSK